MRERDAQKMYIRGGGGERGDEAGGQEGAASEGEEGDDDEPANESDGQLKRLAGLPLWLPRAGGLAPVVRLHGGGLSNVLGVLVVACVRSGGNRGSGGGSGSGVGAGTCTKVVLSGVVGALAR